MLFDFKVCDRLIFKDRDISNFCKSFVYLKAIAEKEAVLRERLANGFRPWDLEVLVYKIQQLLHSLIASIMWSFHCVDLRPVG